MQHVMIMYATMSIGQPATGHGIGRWNVLVSSSVITLLAPTLAHSPCFCVISHNINNIIISSAESDPQMEMGMKHAIIQDVVVNQVYLGGDTPLVEELGFGTGEKGYATMQYVLAYHENDPLCMQYTSSSMAKIWQAAGLDLQNASNIATATGGKLPMSAPH